MDWFPLVLLNILVDLAFWLLILLIMILRSIRKTNRTLIRISRLLKKHVVTVTVVSVKTEAASYDHGATVNISGDVSADGVPQSGVSVSFTIEDASSNEFALPDSTTSADGKFTASWIIPPEVAPGVCTVSATALGMTVSATFTFSDQPRMSLFSLVFRLGC